MTKVTNTTSKSMINAVTLAKRLTATVAISSIALLASVTHADSNKVSSNQVASNQVRLSVDLTESHFVQPEIAVLQVLSEICPPMLNSKQQNGFYNTYNKKLKQILPASISDPRAAVNYLSTQQDYKEMLVSIRSMTMDFPREENLALCTDLAELKF